MGIDSWCSGGTWNQTERADATDKSHSCLYQTFVAKFRQTLDVVKLTTDPRRKLGRVKGDYSCRSLRSTYLFAEIIEVRNTLAVVAMVSRKLLCRNGLRSG